MGYLDRGRLSRWVSLAAAVTLPVKPCEACQAEGWEQQPLLAGCLSVLRKCCHFSGHPRASLLRGHQQESGLGP